MYIYFIVIVYINIFVYYISRKFDLSDLSDLRLIVWGGVDEDLWWFGIDFYFLNIIIFFIFRFFYILNFWGCLYCFFVGGGRGDYIVLYFLNFYGIYWTGNSIRFIFCSRGRYCFFVWVCDFVVSIFRCIGDSL